MYEEKEKSSFLHFLKIGILLAGDAVIAIGAYSLSWYLRSVSNLGIFRGALSSDAFQRIPHHLWFIALTQVFFLYMAGLYTTEARPEVKRIGIRTSQALFVQMIILSVFYALSAGPDGYPLSILPLFLVLNILFCTAWRIIAFRRIFVLFLGIAKPKEFVLNPEEEGVRALEECNLLLSEIKRLQKKKGELQGRIEELGERISSEGNGGELAKILRLKKYYSGERGKVAITLVEARLKAKNDIKPFKRERRQVEKRLNRLKEKVLILGLEKEEVEKNLPEKEYLAQGKKLEEKIKSEEKETKRLSKVIDSYEETLLKKFPSSFRLYFEYFFLVKLKLPYEVADFFAKDLARLFIVAFMVLLISCAFLLILKKEKAAEEVANVAYFSLVIGVVMELVLMIKQRKSAGHRIKDNARSRR